MCVVCTRFLKYTPYLTSLVNLYALVLHISVVISIPQRSGCPEEQHVLGLNVLGNALIHPVAVMQRV